MTKVTKKFETEVQQLLDLVIHSLYSNRDIFLRELISNAADAIDKARFEATSNEALLEGDPAWKIRIAADQNAGTLTISDNGIGMTIEEVETNIGTIAHSGTRAFLENLKEKSSQERPELIGQFGVGFYSSFMVADRVTILTRKAGHDKNHGCHWESTGDGSYVIEDCVKEGRGTEVTLHLKEEMKEYLDERRIRVIVKKYSDYVQDPIVMAVSRTEVPKGADGKPIEGAGTIERTNDETLNSMKAIWTRAKSEISDEEYHEFYRHISHDFDKPFRTIHYAAEGVSEFKALLYIPSHKPLDMFMRDQKRGIQLYVKRVFITDHCEGLLPEYLRFVKGVVDSSDLPLNVSREILQEDVQIRRIQKNLVTKILATLAELKEKEPAEYLKFYREFGPVLKEGLHFDPANREKLQELLLFESSRTAAGEYVSLRDYVNRMPATQQDIYFITGDSRSAVENSPHLEIFRKNAFEVLFLTDPVDEWVMQSLPEYDNRQFKGVDRGDLELGTAEEQKAQETEQEAKEKQYRELLDFIKQRLADQVKEVRLSKRLTESACCLVADQAAISAHMERMLRAMNQGVPETKRILELNPDHPLMQAMAAFYAKDKESGRLADYCELLYDQALLTEGTPIKDPLRFTRLVADLMVAAAKI